MKNQGMTTQDHSEKVADSLINGQFKQAKQQFIAALHDACSATALLHDILGMVGEEKTLTLAGSIIGDSF